MIHPIILLSFATFVLVAGFALWSLLSARRRQKHGPAATGIGGPNDPLA
jgi:hypothetical protein